MIEMLSFAVGWLKENLASHAGPAVSLLGAGVSWYWAKKRMLLDAGKELGTLRADTLELLENALLLDNPTWRRNSLRDFHKSHVEWLRLKEERVPLMSKKSFAKVLEVQDLLDKVKSDVLGMPLGGLAAQEILYDDSDFEPNQIDDQNRDKLVRLIKSITRDPRFLAR